MLNMEEITQQLEKTYLENGEITEISLVPAGDLPSIPGFPMKNVPEHIKICVTAKPEPESNIRIELWLPAAGWNGDLVGIGNGGPAGIDTRTGQESSGNPPNAALTPKEKQKNGYGVS